MACFHPIKAWRSRDGRNVDTGKWPITFNRSEGYEDKEILIPCGQCVGCRLEKSRVWALRCFHESQLYDYSWFVTLTYADAPTSLQPDDFTKFMKRLRKKFGVGVRYFMCGEYGENFGRAHHHALLFNLPLCDLEYWSGSGQNRLYRSPTLEKLWSFGFVLLGSVTFESCAYVARYIMKKVTGDMALEHYVDETTGEIRHPEYIRMSRRPGIGLNWLNRFKREVLAHSGMCYVNGMFVSIPRYYEDKLLLTDSEFVLTKKAQGAKFAREHYCVGDNHPDRLATREECRLLALRELKRPLEQARSNSSYVDLHKELKL